MRAYDKLDWLVDNLSEWYMFGWVAYVEAEEIHWHHSYMQGFTEQQWIDRKSSRNNNH